MATKRQMGDTARWQDEPMTTKQREYIEEMQEFSPYKLPPFNGMTKGEACSYINKWTKLAHENTWAIENGYA